MDSPAVALLQRLGLSDEELCTILDVDPLTVITGDLDHRPELGILLALTAEADERVGERVLQRWLRTVGPSGMAPIDLLLTRDFGGFEDALAVLEARGWIIRANR